MHFSSLKKNWCDFYKFHDNKQMSYSWGFNIK